MFNYFDMKSGMNLMKITCTADIKPKVVNSKPVGSYSSNFRVCYSNHQQRLSYGQFLPEITWGDRESFNSSRQHAGDNLHTSLYENQWD